MPPLDDASLASIKTAIVRVGSDDGTARGFVVEAQRRVFPPAKHLVPFVPTRLVLTAAHCLPFLPPPHPASFHYERTYLALLGPLGAEPTVAAECLFVDPIRDVAVLGAPDGQAGFDDDAYDALVEACIPLPVGTVTAPFPAWLLTVPGEWVRCEVRVNHYGAANTLVLVGAGEGNRPGTSGSPIITADGCAVGIVSVGGEIDGIACVEHHGQPRLASCLPAWLLTELRMRAEA